MHKFIYALAFVVLLSPGMAIAAGVTPDQVETLTGASASAPQLDQDSLGDALDHQADMATRALGKDNPDWNDKNPKWSTIYGRVRADIAQDNKPMLDYGQQSHHDIDAMIAENLTPEDVKAITDYLNTDEGQRYQDFSKMVDGLMHASMAPMLGQSSASDRPPPAVQLSKEQVEQYLKLLGASLPVQILAATTRNLKSHESHSTADDVFVLTQAITIKMHPEEIQKLNDEFGGDIEKFNAFNQTPAQRHLFHGMATAMQQMMDKTRSLAKAQLPNQQKHKDEWQVLYQHEVENKYEDAK